MRKRGRKSHSETTNRTKEQRVEFQEEITAIFSLGKVKCAWKSVFHSEPWSLLFKAPEKSDNSLLRMPPVQEATNAKGRVSQTAFLTSLVCCPPPSLAYAILPLFPNLWIFFPFWLHLQVSSLSPSALRYIAMQGWQLIYASSVCSKVFLREDLIAKSIRHGFQSWLCLFLAMSGTSSLILKMEKAVIATSVID